MAGGGLASSANGGRVHLSICLGGGVNRDACLLMQPFLRPSRSSCSAPRTLWTSSAAPSVEEAQATALWDMQHRVRWLAPNPTREVGWATTKVGVGAAAGSTSMASVPPHCAPTVPMMVSPTRGGLVGGLSTAVPTAGPSPSEAATCGIGARDAIDDSKQGAGRVVC